MSSGSSKKYYSKTHRGVTKSEIFSRKKYFLEIIFFHEVLFSPTLTPIGKEPTLPDIIEIKIREVNARYLQGEYDSNLYVEFMVAGTTTITTQHGTQPDDVIIYYEKAVAPKPKKEKDKEDG